MNTSFLDDIFTISHDGKDVIERKGSDNKILWERAIPKTTSKSASVSLTNTRKTGGDGVTYPVFAPSKVLPSVIAYGKCIQSDSPAPDAPEDIVCNNGTLKAFYGNKYTDVEAQTGMILQKASHAIQSNANYIVSAPIFLKAGEYKVSYTTDAAGSRPFIICEALPNGNPVPVEDGEVWFKGTPTVGINTDTFTVDHDMNVLISLRKTFTDVFVGPVSAITYADGTLEEISLVQNLVEEIVARKAVRAGQVTEANPLGSEISKNAWSCTDYIAVNPSTEYTTVVPRYAAAAGAGLVFFSGTTVESAISGVTTNLQGSGTYTFTTPSNCHYLRFSWSNADGDDAIMFVGHTLQTASVANLFAIEDDQDTQDIITGEVVRNIGVKVFDGTESYTSMSYGYATDELSNFPNENFAPLCTHFVGKATSTAALDTVRLYFTSGGVPRTYFFVDQTVDDFSTADKFKAWIAAQYAAGTPVMVVYPLATPQTEQVTSTSGQISLDHKGTYTLSTSGSVSNLQIQATYLGR